MKVDIIPAEFADMYNKFIQLENEPYQEGDYNSSDGLIIDRYIDGALYRMTLEFIDNNKIGIKSIERRK